MIHFYSTNFAAWAVADALKLDAGGMLETVSRILIASLVCLRFVYYELTSTNAVFDFRNAAFR